MNERLKKLLEGVERWSEPEQAELVDILEQIEIRHSGEYHASREELQALDEAERRDAQHRSHRQLGLSPLALPISRRHHATRPVWGPSLRRAERPTASRGLSASASRQESLVLRFDSPTIRDQASATAA